MKATDQQPVERMPREGPIRMAGARVRWARFSERQKEIATRFALGESRREISAALGLTGKTVDTHRRVILDRLEVRGTADITRVAIAAGVITVEVEP
jgi:DNA-binding NarL/FixJ family response regulator